MEESNRRLCQLYAHRASAWVQTMANPTLEQRAEFVRWLKESPRNVRDFLFMLTVDQALGRIDERRDRSISELLAQIDASVAFLPSVGSARTRPRRRGWAAVAAVAVLTVVASWLLLAQHNHGWREFATGSGEQRAFALEDGSIIHLNTQSRVVWRFSGTTREIRLLGGEVFFRVHHETSRPFRVYTADAVIQATGTQFDVYDRLDGTQVAVIEGRVDVTAEAHPALAIFAIAPRESGQATAAPRSRGAAARSLGANEEVHVDRSGAMSVPALSDVTRFAAWRERRLVFQEESLRQIVDEFNRYGHAQFRLEGEAVEKLSFSGVFDADDPDSLAQVLARDSSLAVTVSDGTIVVRPR